MKYISVAIVVDDKFPSGSGVSRSVQTQVEELTRQGHMVTLIVPRSDIIIPKNARVITVPSFRLPGMPKHTRILCASRRTSREISEKYRFDVVHSQTDTGALLLASKLAQMQRIPHVHTFHTNIAGAHTVSIPTFFASLGYRLCAATIARIHMRCLPRCRTDASRLASENYISRFDWRTQAIIAYAVDASTTPSQYMSTYICAASNGLLSSIAVVRTGYNRTFERYVREIRLRMKQSDSKIRFISISRLVKEKRVDIIIESFKSAAIHNSELVIVGDGAERDSLVRLAKGDVSISFTGHVGSLKRVAQLLCGADVFVLASYRFDNQPIVIPEALVAGVPILYCDDRLDVGLKCGNSLLVHPDANSLATGMRQIVKPRLHQQLVEGTKDALADLSPHVTGSDYVTLYRQVIYDYGCGR